MDSGLNAGLRQDLARALAQADAANGPTSVSAAAAQLYRRLSDQLAPLIGHAGVAAISARSLQLTQREYPWLGQLSASGPDEALARVCETLDSQPLAAAAAGGAAWLATFCEQLVGLIGVGLTRRFLREAWPGIPLDTPVQEEK